MRPSGPKIPRARYLNRSNLFQFVLVSVGAADSGEAVTCSPISLPPTITGAIPYLLCPPRPQGAPGLDILSSASVSRSSALNEVISCGETSSPNART